MPAPLSLITTLARSGALDRAWALFREGGYDRASEDSAALAVKGRLLKDRAWRASGAARVELLARAGASYAAADIHDPQPYLLINAAACRALAGDQRGATAAADAVLDRIAPGKIVAETPYWLCATRAEALLIKDDVTGAQAALQEAYSHDPDGYEDHAVTLRQFSRLITVLGGDKTWLDGHRPPTSLHFSGHLGIDEGASDVLRDAVDAILIQDNVGFGFGALAAGSDIVIAEALIARGAELHLTFPAAVDDFCRLSVAPYGAGWVPRFEACLAGAKSVRIAAQVDAEAFEPLATALASDLAMGAALLNARRLESKAIQLLVIDEGDGPYGGGKATARDGGAWLTTGETQRVIRQPRSNAVAPSSAMAEGRADRRLFAAVMLQFSGLDALGDGAFARAFDDEIAPFLTRIQETDDAAVRTQPCGNGRILAFADCQAAALFGRHLADLSPPDGFPLRIAGHYGLFLCRDDMLIGSALSALEDLVAATHDGTFTVSNAFATALQIAGGADRFDAQYVGDCILRSDDAGTSLFTISV
jgi:hypothetical protein